MARPPRVLILVHEHDGYPGREVHQIWALVRLWRAGGFDVRVARGPMDPVALTGADLVIPHVNLSVTPPVYRDWLDRQPRVLNRGVYDISKRAISRHLVTEDDGYEGPVIVKTNLNYGGLPERGMAFRRRQASLLGRLRRRLFGRAPLEAPRPASLEAARAMDHTGYRVFDCKAHVPAGVFRNEHLVVERFLPERRGDLFLLRAYLFLGDRHVSEVRGGFHPIVKGRGRTVREPCDPHAGIVALRREMGWDFGKFDYVVRDGDAVLLDANRTPGKAGDPAYNRARARTLAPGLRALLEGRGLRTPSTDSAEGVA